MTLPTRIGAEEVYKKVTSSDAILVCAYDSDEKFERFRIEGAIPFSKFRDMLSSLPKTREIIFYCA